MLKRSIAGMLASGALLALIATGHAQEMANADQLAVGLVPGGIIRPNPPFMVINPSTNKPFLPFQAPVPPPNDSPNPFNNPFPLSPNSQPSEGRGLRVDSRFASPRSRASGSTRGSTYPRPAT